MRMIIVFEVIDDWTIVKLSQEERGAEAAVADDQVGPCGDVAATGLEDPSGVGHGILEGAGVIAVGPTGPALRSVLDPPNPLIDPGGEPGDEGASAAKFADKATGDVPELRRVILMNIENMHNNKIKEDKGGSRAGLGGAIAVPALPSDDPRKVARPR
jgi:hypothetical protein